MIGNFQTLGSIWSSVPDALKWIWQSWDYTVAPIGLGLLIWMFLDQRKFNRTPKKETYPANPNKGIGPTPLERLQQKAYETDELLKTALRLPPEQAIGTLNQWCEDAGAFLRVEFPTQVEYFKQQDRFALHRPDGPGEDFDLWWFNRPIQPVYSRVVECQNRLRDIYVRLHQEALAKAFSTGSANDTVRQTT